MSFINLSQIATDRLAKCVQLLRKAIHTEYNAKNQNTRFINDWRCELKLFQRELGRRGVQP